MKIDTMQIKQLNTELIKSELKKTEESSWTKISLSAATGLSQATCRNIIEEMLVTGEVVEIEPAGSTGGRRSRQFQYNSDFAHIGILYARIEGDQESIYTAVFNMSGNLLNEKYYDFNDISLSDIDFCISELISFSGKIESLSVGLPGIVNNGVVGLCDLKKLENIPVENYLSDKYKIPVSVENDVNSSVLGYYRNENNFQHESIVYLYCPEYGNPGAGIVINGRILKGKSNFAGEISFLPVAEGRDSQEEIQRDIFNFSDYIVKIIRTLNAVLDPEIMVLTGRRINQEIRDKISHIIKEEIPSDHLPIIRYEEDLHESFTAGLKNIASDNLGIGLKVVAE